MRYPVSLLALGAALAASPALAQVNVGAGAQADVNVGAGVNPGGILGGVTGTLDRTVDTVDRTVNRTLGSDLRLATAADLTAGVEVRDSRGRRIGVVQAVHGDMAMVVQGGRTFHVPLAALYRGSRGLVTSLTDAELRAAASAHAHGNAHAGTHE